MLKRALSDKLLAGFFSSLLLVSACTSCGLLGISTTKPEDQPTDDDAFREAVLDRLENDPASRRNDSLIAKIDAATETWPSDLATTTLIVETYDFKGYAATFYNKFRTIDSVKLKKRFAKYEKNKERTIKKPKYKTMYADQKTYEILDPVTYRYVLKQTIRHEYDRSELTVTNAGEIYAYVLQGVYYLYDRQTDAVFREIKDWSVLEK